MKRALQILLAILLSIFLVATGIAFYFSGQISAISHGTAYDTKVISLDDTSVTLASNHDTTLVGKYAITWPEGSAQVDDIISSDPKTVTRHLTNSPTSLNLTPGTKVHWDENLYAGDPKTTLGLDFEDVKVPGQVGIMPAWYVAGISPTWVIMVHGHDSTRETSLRMMPALHDAGYPVLAITYRNDVDAPSSKDNKDHLGASEWHDVDSAITYAHSHGAAKVVLYGYSMGGALVSETVRHSDQANLIQAEILDSPVLDWRTTLDHQGKENRLPLVESCYAEKIFALQNGFSFSEMDQVKHAFDFDKPILLFYGTSDNYVPTEPDAAFAKKLPNLVTLVPIPHAGHTGGWNVDQQNYEFQVISFLARNSDLVPTVGG